jgi:Na+-transporting NADH:ubiquinone oxidoreductase subunit F
VLAASPARDLTARLVEIHDEAAGAKTFRISVPEDFAFVPGMWVMVQFPDKREQAGAYSISSSPLAKGHIDLSFCKVGPLTQRLWEARPGQELLLKGPYGNWRYDDGLAHAVLVTDGTGITPYRSMARYVLETRLKNKLTFVYSARTEKHFLYHDDLAKFERHGFKVYRTVTHPEECAGWKGATGSINGELLKREVDGFADASYYLCGPKAFVQGVKEDLLSRGIPAKQILFENWGDYKWD